MFVFISEGEGGAPRVGINFSLARSYCGTAGREVDLNNGIRGVIGEFGAIAESGDGGGLIIPGKCDDLDRMCLFKNAVLLLDSDEGETGCAAPKDVVIDDDGDGRDGLDSVDVATDLDERGVAGEEYKGLVDNPENLVCKLMSGS